MQSKQNKLDMQKVKAFKTIYKDYLKALKSVCKGDKLGVAEYYKSNKPIGLFVSSLLNYKNIVENEEIIRIAINVIKKNNVVKTSWCKKPSFMWNVIGTLGIYEESDPKLDSNELFNKLRREYYSMLFVLNLVTKRDIILRLSLSKNKKGYVNVEEEFWNEVAQRIIYLKEVLKGLGLSNDIDKIKASTKKLNLYKKELCK